MIMQRGIWSAVSTATGLVAALAANSALKAGWRRARHEEPPVDPAAREVDWPQAMAWVALSALVIALAKLAAARGTAAGWERVRHERAPTRH
jgi:hypothetical protein